MDRGRGPSLGVQTDILVPLRFLSFRPGTEGTDVRVGSLPVVPTVTRGLNRG